MAIRHSRRIVGEHVWSREDAIHAPDYDDIIVRLPGGNIDMVLVHGMGDANPGIPYRCLVPKRVDGLLAAGRCLSSDYGILRGGGLGSSLALGQAAGIAAVQALKDDVAPRDVDVDAVRRTLVEMGETMERTETDTWW